MNNEIQFKARRAELPFLLLSNEEGKQLAPPESRKSFEVAEARTSELTLYRQTGLPSASIRLLRQPSLPGHGARVRYSLGTNVNTSFFQVPKQEFEHGAGTREKGRGLVLGHKSGP